MNRKTIFGISLLLIAVFAIGSVSAIDFGSFLGGEQNQTVTIDGIDFNIPDGYKEDPNHETVNQTNQKGIVTYITNGKLYEKGNTIVSLLVADYGDYKVTDEIAASVGGDTKTLNNVSGYSSQNGQLYVFDYAKNDKLVILSSNDENAIGDFIVG